MQTDDKQHRSILQRIAHRAMLQRGLLPDFSAEALAELGRIQAPASMINGFSIAQAETPTESIPPVLKRGRND